MVSNGNLNNKNLIALSGRMQSGKNTVAKIINQLTNNKYEEKCFADALKDIVCILIDCKREQLENINFKNSYIGEEWSSGQKVGSETTIRELLQILGTDLFRNQLHENTWTNVLFNKYKESPQNVLINEGYKLEDVYPKWIITDVRFPNEVQAIKERNGIIIRVNRFPKDIIIDGQLMKFDKGSNKHLFIFDNQHESETALDDYNFDYTIDNDDTIEELIEKVREILIKEKII